MDARNDLDFDCIVLTREEENALRYLNGVGALPDSLLDSEPYSRLLWLGLIETCSSDEFPPPENFSTPFMRTIFQNNAICVSDKGKDYLAYLDRKRKDRRRSNLFAVLIALIGAAAGVVFTLLVEHAADIHSIFQSLIQRV